MNKLEIQYQAGGVAGWVRCDQGIMVQVIGVCSSASDVKATWAARLADPEYIGRLTEAWSNRGYTFKCLK